jgi:eukaryotic-like serine/threonine-protein kinase
MAKRHGKSTVISPAPDDQGKRFFRLVLLFSAAIIAVMIIASVVAFVLTIEGEEQTLVPDILGMDLSNAMIELQQKGLTAKVQLRISANPADKGSVLNQEPGAGTLVKVGRSIDLRVSKGPIIDEVDNYVGMQLSELRLQIQSISTIFGPLLVIADPVNEIYDDAPAGTILEQKPEPGTKITDLTDLALIVSRGPHIGLVKIPDYLGLRFYDALISYSELDAPFIFYSRQAEGDEEYGVIVSQQPAPDADVDEGTLVQFMITEPEEVEEEWMFGIYQEVMRDYPTHITLIIEIARPGEDPVELLTMKHPGGLISIPYLEPIGTEIIISSSLRELFRYEIRAPVE